MKQLRWGTAAAADLHVCVKPAHLQLRLRKRPQKIYLQSVMWPLFMQVKFLLISLLPAFSLLQSLSLPRGEAAAAFPSPLCHLHSLLPPSASRCFHPPFPFFRRVFADETGSLPVFHISWQQSGEPTSWGWGAAGKGAGPRKRLHLHNVSVEKEKLAKRRERVEKKEGIKEGEAGLDQLNDSPVQDNGKNPLGENSVCRGSGCMKPL